MTDSAMVILEVCAGVVPGVPETEHTRRWVISSARWHELEAMPGLQAEALAKLNGEAQGYAMLLMLQPERFNWVKVEWLSL